MQFYRDNKIFSGVERCFWADFRVIVLWKRWKRSFDSWRHASFYWGNQDLVVLTLMNSICAAREESGKWTPANASSYQTRILGGVKSEHIAHYSMAYWSLFHIFHIVYIQIHTNTTIATATRLLPLLPSNAPKKSPASPAAPGCPHSPVPTTTSPSPGSIDVPPPQRPPTCDGSCEMSRRGEVDVKKVHFGCTVHEKPWTGINLATYVMYGNIW